MSDDNNVTVETVATTTESTAPAAPKRSLNEASDFRLAFERNSLREKQERKALLEQQGKQNTKGYVRCCESITKVEELIASIESKKSKRLERAAAKVSAAPANDAAQPVETVKSA